MNINISYDDTDVAKAMASIIKHPNAEEFIALLTPMICNSSPGSAHFFKLLLGNKLPDILPNGTLCYIKIDNLGYNATKDLLLKSDLVNSEQKIIIKIKEFRGHHEYSQYHIEYTNIKDTGERYTNSTYVEQSYLEEIEEL